MKLAPIFGGYCLLILLGFTVAKYEGWALFGSTGRAIAAAAGGTRSGGSTGFHK
jgi:hypothetical protein